MSNHAFNSPELKDFNPKDYHFYGLWKNNLFGTCFWQDCWDQELVNNLGLEMNEVGTINLMAGHYLAKNSIRAKISQQVKKAIDDNNKDFFAKLVQSAEKVFNWVEMMGESLSSAKPNIKNFQDFIFVARRMNFLWLIAATYLIVPVEEKLRDIVIKEKFPPERIIEIIPKVKTPLYYYQKGIVELKNEVEARSLKEIEKNDKKLLQKLQEHVKKYSWIETANFVGDSLTVDRLCEQMNHIKECSEVEEEYTNNNLISDRLKFAAQCMHDIGYIKQGGAEYFSIFSDKVRPFINAIAKKIGLNYHELIHLSITEVDKALKGILNNKEIRERVKRRTNKDEWALISDKHGKSILIEDKEDVKLLHDIMIPRADQSMKELMGQVGNKGKCTGNAKVIMNNREFHKMQTGDILVTTMTTPDFVILMQKSGAIITDIGGLLSHASIVSREMNKPCVVGTKFATKIIKDGDLVKVDANKGIIKILKRAKE